MESYGFLNIPEACIIASTVYKKRFYENVDLTRRDKTLFTDTINKIKWLYCLKSETIHIPAYKDEVQEYQEIEVIEVGLKKKGNLERIAEIIMKAIPYPMLLIFRLDDKMLFYTALQRLNQSDSSKNIIEEFVATEWLDHNSVLFASLDVKKMRFTNLYAFYSDIVDTISIYNVAHIIPEGKSVTGAQARQLASQLEEIDKEIVSLRARLKKEVQFNRKMELNLEIKRLEQNKNTLPEGVLE